MSKRDEFVSSFEEVDESDGALSIEDLARQGYQLRPDFGTSEIMRAQVDAEGGMTVGHFKLTSVGLEVREGVTEPEWGQLGALLHQLNGSLQWLIGDWLVCGEDRQWGKTYQEAEEETGYSYQTLRDYAYVARHVHLSIRIDKLSFQHHRLIAPLDRQLQRTWLDYAITCVLLLAPEEYSVAKMRREMKLLKDYGSYEQLQWLNRAMQNGSFLSQIKDLNPSQAEEKPTAPLPEQTQIRVEISPDTHVEARKHQAYLSNLPDLAHLDKRIRPEAMKRAQWIVAYGQALLREMGEGD